VQQLAAGHAWVHNILSGNFLVSREAHTLASVTVDSRSRIYPRQVKKEEDKNKRKKE
jgi:hypothetical protein